jgi:hypothetical protein
MADKPVVTLYESACFGLIVEYPSGVEFMNQVAGYACYHPVLEGFFLPLCSGEFGIEQRVIGVFGEYGYWKGITEQMADEVDAVLDSYYLTKELCVDRSRLKETYEAWVWVCGRCPALSDLGEIRGVLTWENSD